MCLCVYVCAYHSTLLLGLIGLDLKELGIPSEDDMIELYCRHTGTPDITDWSLYLAFTFFRAAAILQGVYKRSLQSKKQGKEQFN